MNAELVARFATLTQTKAIVIASRFPGLDISLNEDGSYRIHHSIDPSFDADNISLDNLLVSTKSVLMELQQRYGPGGERLGQIEPSYLIHALPAV